MYNTRPTTRERPGRDNPASHTRFRNWTPSHIVFENLKYPKGWRRFRRQRPGWCDGDGCGRCCWGQIRWTWRRDWPEGRVWKSGSSLEQKPVVSSRKQNEIFTSVHSNHTTSWRHVNGYSLSTLTVDSEVIWKLAGITYSMLKHLPFSSAERKRGKRISPTFN